MENQKNSSDEDIPSDFFDDFNKDEFMEGLSVIDSWDDDEKKRQNSRSRINTEKLGTVRDLRELIDRESQEKQRGYNEKYEEKLKYKKNVQDLPNRKKSRDKRRDGSISHMDEYIKPGSRRDPSKTNEAIKKDKEVKVKEYLAKHLESSDDLRPPGTELDDFFEEHRSVEIKKHKFAEKDIPDLSPLRKHRGSPVKYRRESPPIVRRRESPPQKYYHHRMHLSPRRQYYGPLRSPRRSPHRNVRNFVPYKSFRNFHRDSPRRRERRGSSDRSPEIVRRERRSRSRSPYKRLIRRTRSRSIERRLEREERRRSPSRSSSHIPGKDDFLYPKSYFPPPTEYPVVNEQSYPVASAPLYAEPTPVEYGTSSYSYAPGPAYSGYGASYEYEVQLPPMVMPAPQPVPAPVLISTTPDPSVMNPMQQPSMVPPPQKILQTVASYTPNVPHTTPTDALAQLVADGKLSHEDYLKLAPNKGANKLMDTHTREAVLSRCYKAMTRLGGIMLPNRLLINKNPIGDEQKQIVSKFCSPLKRQAVSDFYFTKFSPSGIAQQNKRIVDSIISTLNIEKVVGKPKKKSQKETREIAVQTTKTFCEMCEIREATKYSDVSTSTDPEYFTSTVHTQVVEQDLYSSKAVFNPTGGMAEGANISIAHMTPAQLVSQLAARAKTLKQSEPHLPNQFRHDSRYDYDGRGDQYRNYNNYRY